MATKKMLILPGNSFVGKGSQYPNELGIPIEWPYGALHRPAVKEYARLKGYEHDISISPGQPQGETSAQTIDGVEFFKEQVKAQAECAFYGFSGGGYNMWFILHRLANEHAEHLHLIKLVVVLGAPKVDASEYQASKYNQIAKKKVAADKWKDATWELVYGKDPPGTWPLPNGVTLPRGIGKHMFGPEWLLAGMPGG